MIPKATKQTTTARLRELRLLPERKSIGQRVKAKALLLLRLQSKRVLSDGQVVLVLP